MRSILLLLLSWLACGCSSDLGMPGSTIALRGRVVDAETCASEAGCTGIPGMIVALASDPEHSVSAPSAADGTFVLSGITAGYRQDVIVRPSAGQMFAPTINPMVIAASDRMDVFGAELYAVPRDPASLLVGLRTDGIDLLLGGGYIGQVVRVTGSTLTAADNVSILVHPPQAPTRFVQVLPRFVTGEPTLRPADATTTGPFGLFVIPALGPADPVAIIPQQAGFEYDLVVAPFEPGFVTYAVHRSR